MKALLTTIASLAVSLSLTSAGEWTETSYKIDGTWNLQASVLKLDEAFGTKKGPDLRIFLSPLPITELTGKNATEGSVLVSALKSNEGAQSYELPEGIDLSRFQSIIIHCERYSKLWGAAALEN